MSLYALLETHTFVLFLKGGSTTSYYDAFGVDPAASMQDIKEAHYSAMDEKKCKMTASDREKAYKVLLNPQRRRRFNLYGDEGLELVEHPQQVLTKLGPSVLLRNFQKNEGGKKWLGILYLLLFMYGLIQPVVIAAKADDEIKTGWISCWTPTWCLDLIMFATIFWSYFHKDEPEWREDKDGEEIIDHGWFLNNHDKLVNTCIFLLYFMGQCMILYQLDYGTSNWFGIFSPWYCYEIWHVGIRTHGAFMSDHKYPVLHPTEQEPNISQMEAGNQDLDQDHDYDSAVGDDDIIFTDVEGESSLLQPGKLSPEEEAEVYEYYRKIGAQKDKQRHIFNGVLRFTFSLMLASKLQNDSSMYWSVTFIPMWLWLILRNCFACYYGRLGLESADGVDFGSIYSGNSKGVEELAKGKYSLTMMLTCFVMFFCQGVPLFMVISLEAFATQVRAPAMSLGVVLVPFWISMIVMFCCCMCFVAGATCTNPDEIDSKISEYELKAQEAATRAAQQAVESNMSQMLEAPLINPEDLTDEQKQEISEGNFDSLGDQISPMQKAMMNVMMSSANKT